MTPVAPVSMMPAALPSILPPAVAVEPQAGVSFQSLLSNGFNGMEHRLAMADSMVRRFALGEDIPVHQVTFALEEARLSVELALQVRSRLVEGYRELMNMQL